MMMHPKERAAHGERPIGFTEAIRRSKSIPEGHYLYMFYDVNENRISSCFCHEDESVLLMREGSDWRITRPLTPSRLWKFLNSSRDDFGLPPI